MKIKFYNALKINKIQTNLKNIQKNLHYPLRVKSKLLVLLVSRQQKRVIHAFECFQHFDEY